MSKPASAEHVARLIDPRAAEAVDLMGPTIEFLTPPEEGNAPCTMRGTVPPGAFVPLHSHADPETFLPVSGELEGLVHSGDSAEWVRISPGDVFHIPGGAKHAFRNRSGAPAVTIVVSTGTMGRFFKEIGTPVEQGGDAGAPSGETIRRFLETSERYGYWNATPQENAELGIPVPAPG